MGMCAADAVQVQARGDAVQSLHDRGVTWVSFRPMPDFVSDIDFRLRKLPGLGLLSGAVQGIRHEHTRRDSGDGDDDFSFHINVRGLSHVSGCRGDTTLRDGDAMLLSYSVSRAIIRPDRVDQRVIRLPRASLAPLVREIDDFVLRPIACGTGMLGLLQRYVDAVFDDPALERSETRQLIVSQLCDLVAVTLGATRDAAAIAEGRGVRAARLRAVKADIEAHLAHAHLSPGAVAKRQKVSDSYIRKLFEREGTTFTHYLLARRLERARRMLTDPRWAERSIASIAFDVGFGDLAYFNRTFKRLHGATPSEVRRHRSSDADG
jgi:AraC-like DNA-binding protein